MKLWTVVVDAKAVQPLDWGRCSIKSRSSGWLGGNRYVVEANDRAVEALRQQAAVISVEPAADGTYADDSGFTFEVSSGGTRWSLLD